MASFLDGASVFTDHLLDCALDLPRRSDDPIFVHKCTLRYSVPEQETLAPDVVVNGMPIQGHAHELRYRFVLERIGEPQARLFVSRDKRPTFEISSKFQGLP